MGFQVNQAALAITPKHHEAKCPAKLHLNPTIEATGKGTVKYRFVDQLGNHSQTFLVKFDKSDVKFLDHIIEIDAKNKLLSDKERLKYPRDAVERINPWLLTKAEERKMLRDLDPDIEANLHPPERLYWGGLLNNQRNGALMKHLYPWRHCGIRDDHPLYSMAVQTPDWLRPFNGMPKPPDEVNDGQAQ